MSDFNDVLNDALELRQEENPDQAGDALQCVWNGQTLPVVAGSFANTRELGLGGWGHEFELTLIILYSDFESVQQTNTPSLPVPKQTLIYPDTTSSGSPGALYRIEKIETPPGGAFVALGCNQPTKGA